MDVNILKAVPADHCELSGRSRLPGVVSGSVIFLDWSRVDGVWSCNGALVYIYQFQAWYFPKTDKHKPAFHWSSTPVQKTTAPGRRNKRWVGVGTHLGARPNNSGTVRCLRCSFPLWHWLSCVYTLTALLRPKSRV